MKDPRIAAYAKLLVERCVNVQPGWQVMVLSTPLARPLLEEVVRCIAQRGAYALQRLNFAPMHNGPMMVDMTWAHAAPESILGEMPPLERHVYEHIDAAILIGAPENTRTGSDLSQARQLLVRQSARPALQRQLSFKMPWVGCRFPTPALAQEEGMTLTAYADFVFGACLLDWDEEGRKMRRIADRFDRADRVRIVGAETDLTLSLKDRRAMVDDGHFNMPGGEIFYSPVEDSTEGAITYAEYPALYGGNEVEGARLVFKSGKVVEASARRNEAFLLRTLDTDAGARVLGELGIGCNPGVQRAMKDVLFSEKVYGTVHLAIGAGFPFLGGANVSSVHWDMVKDLRQGGRIYCDGELVQENGAWVF
ncbi:MAG TPA: aminopeptidase [Anaerolineae bacterium]|nr:aminopeptidase [Anaerolineae bacterium]